MVATHANISVPASLLSTRLLGDLRSSSLSPGSLIGDSEGGALEEDASAQSGSELRPFGYPLSLLEETSPGVAMEADVTIEQLTLTIASGVFFGHNDEESLRRGGGYTIELHLEGDTWMPNISSPMGMSGPGMDLVRGLTSAQVRGARRNPPALGPLWPSCSPALGPI